VTHYPLVSVAVGTMEHVLIVCGMRRSGRFPQHHFVPAVRTERFCSMKGKRLDG
jgi:hypothetical protein